MARFQAVRSQAGRAALLALLVLFLANPADARRHHHKAADDASAAAPGGFDFYLLSLSVAPSFCRMSPRNGSLEECQALTEDRFEQTPLTLHGLWPNRANVSVNRQPQHCGDAPLGELPPALAEDLRRYMPGGPRLQQHEWQTHGTCSGLQPADYFATAVRLARSVNDILTPLFQASQSFGKPVRVQDLVSAVSLLDPALGAALVVDCQAPRGGGPVLIGEVRVTLSRQFEPVPASSVGMGQNSGCPGSGGVLPRVAG